MEGDNDLL